MSDLRVFTFSPDWGLPTTGPFALKLLGWLGYSGIAYEQVIENRAEKGPLGKSPWIEHAGRRMGDSEAIIHYLSRHYDKPVMKASDPASQAIAHVWQAAFEERFHQILEWELFVHPAGRAYIEDMVRSAAPPVIRTAITASVCRHFRRQLHARGIGRHDPERIAAIGRADLDALAAFLDDRPFLTGEEPVLADLAVFGQVAPMFHWPMETPVAMHAKQLATLRAWSDRVMSLCFAREPAL